METLDIFRALVPVAGQEPLVRRRFWTKVRNTLGRVPFVDRAVAAYYAATDPLTPGHAKATLFAALAYFVLPADMIPDFLVGLGFSDDGAVLLMAIRALAPYLTDDHVDRAKVFLNRDRDGEPEGPPA
jgi:uncharacterized membrane protein YkvA (DUF1232 family)